MEMGPIGVLSFMKIPLVSSSLDQKEQNSFGNPQFYSSIAPMLEFTPFGDWMDQINVRSTKGHNFPVFRVLLSLMAAKWYIHICFSKVLGKLGRWKLRGKIGLRLSQIKWLFFSTIPEISKVLEKLRGKSRESQDIISKASGNARKLWGKSRETQDIIS